MIFKITRYFLQLSEDFCLNYSYCLVVVNLYLAFERICYFLSVLPFASVYFSNSSTLRL